MSRDYRGKEMEQDIASTIVQGDMQDIKNSDVILANCPKPSVGTSMEIFYAAQLGKPIIVVAPFPISPWLKYFSTAQYVNLGAGITYARTIAKNFVSPNSELKELFDLVKQTTRKGFF